MLLEQKAEKDREERAQSLCEEIKTKKLNERINDVATFSQELADRMDSGDVNVTASPAVASPRSPRIDNVDNGKTAVPVELEPPEYRAFLKMMEDHKNMKLPTLQTRVNALEGTTCKDLTANTEKLEKAREAFEERLTSIEEDSIPEQKRLDAEVKKLEKRGDALEKYQQQHAEKLKVKLTRSTALPPRPGYCGAARIFFSSHPPSLLLYIPSFLPGRHPCTGTKGNYKK